MARCKQDFSYAAVCLIICLWSISDVASGIKCFECLPDTNLGRDCRRIGPVQPAQCPPDSKHCVAVVLGNAQGDITVFRGCGNHVENFNLGVNECNILDTGADDLPAAYYKCKTDGCNNIEPVTSEVSEVLHPAMVKPSNQTSG